MTTRSIAIPIVLLVVAGAVGYGLYALGTQHGMNTASLAGASTPAAPAKPVDGERRVLYWHDPMVPGQRFDKPGKSPFMDMPLVPVYADEANDDGRTTISPRVHQNLGMRTALVTRCNLGAAVTAVGTVAYND